MTAVLISSSVFAQKNNHNDTSLLQSIEINALRAKENQPITKSNLDKKTIESKNIGYDLPYILNQTPSIQVNADAGNGIGYTGLRLRGTDATRINITINGIPYNDAESQGTYFVDLPDIASSTENIQIQRGVGTSTNGAGAFGGSININTNDNENSKYLKLNNSIGSFGSLKNTLMFNTGLLNNHISFSGRISKISSNGYIERSNANLKSFYSSLLYTNKQYSLRLNAFSGNEKTHAAWFGISETTLDTNRRYNPAGTEKADSPYSNEIDFYTQSHFQLFFNKKINNHFKYNVGLFLSKGKGYFEQYKANQILNQYHLPNYINNNDTVSITDLVRQLWLDNNYYGSIFSIQYDKKKSSLIFGGCADQYEGKHFGKIVDATFQSAVPDNYEWYNVNAKKIELSFYTKWNFKLNSNWQTFVDGQIRKVNYTIYGFQNNPDLMIQNKFLFFNPKAGITYTRRNKLIYFSYAQANKEPNRDDFETNQNETPKPERLHDFELGFELKNKNNKFGVNLYYMNYQNQLVLTGKVNDVYAYTRTNIPASFRNGIELEMNSNISKIFSLSGNLTLSNNKVKNYMAYYDNYDNGMQESKFYKKADLSFSPKIIGSLTAVIVPIKRMNICLNNKYVGKQFLDNTSNNNSIIKAYIVQDLKIKYQLEFKIIKRIDLFIQLNNLLSRKYVANGYTYSYIYGGAYTTENYYYPMATFNFMAGTNIDF